MHEGPIDQVKSLIPARLSFLLLVYIVDDSQLYLEV